MTPKPSDKSKLPAGLDEMIADPVVQLTMRADSVAEEDFRELLRVAGWRVANKRAAGRGDTITADGAHAQTEYRLGVGIMLLDHGNRVLVGRRIDVQPEAWQMPQGGIEPGEEPLDAALRELGEEIGTANVEVLAESVGWHRYDLPPHLIGKAWQGRWRGQLQKWFVMRFLGDDSDINVATASPEFAAWKWMAASQIPGIVVEFKRQLYADILAEFGGPQLGLGR
jgi:putative (di)nucleoside polyphosphate hydrolase